MKAVKYVKKNLNDLGMSSFVSVPVVDRNRTIEKVVHVYPADSPLEDFVTNKENKKLISIIFVYTSYKLPTPGGFIFTLE